MVHSYWFPVKRNNQKLQTPPVADLWQPETKSLNKSGKRGCSAGLGAWPVMVIKHKYLIKNGLEKHDNKRI